MKVNSYLKELLGEFLGTFIIVLIGCGTVALEILQGTFGHIIPIALLWGIGVAVAIFATRKIGPAHLNPAVSIAMAFSKDLEWKKLILFWTAQFSGAFFASMTLFYFFRNSINGFEKVSSVNTAKMFGEYYSVSSSVAFAMEMLGTTFLVFMIYVIDTKIKNHNFKPILIGLVVSIAIVIIAPFTQCGINPARDFAPRIFSHLFGWEEVTFSQSALLVYVVGPLLGGILGFFFFRILNISKK